MATALVLDADGRRENGRWEYGKVNLDDRQNQATFKQKVSQCGVVLDWMPELAPRAGDLRSPSVLLTYSTRRFHVRADALSTAEVIDSMAPSTCALGTSVGVIPTTAHGCRFPERGGSTVSGNSGHDGRGTAPSERGNQRLDPDMRNTLRLTEGIQRGGSTVLPSWQYLPRAAASPSTGVQPGHHDRAAPGERPFHVGGGSTGVLPVVTGFRKSLPRARGDRRGLATGRTSDIAPFHVRGGFRPPGHWCPGRLIPGVGNKGVLGLWGAYPVFNGAPFGAGACLVPVPKSARRPRRPSATFRARLGAPAVWQALGCVPGRLVANGRSP
jgi:hypothetical protein